MNFKTVHNLIKKLQFRSCLLVFLLLIAGAMYSFVNPLIQAPDERGYLYKSYQISTGLLMGVKDTHYLGGYIPNTLQNEISYFLDMRTNKDLKLDYQTFKEQFRKSSILSDLDEKSFVEFHSTNHYSPIVYVPQAIGFLIARAASLSVFTSIYAVRLINLLSALILICIAMHLLQFSPGIQLIFFLILGMPMTLGLMASASVDAVVISLTTLVVALVLNLNHKWDNLKFYYFLFFAILLSLSKTIYALVPCSLVFILLTKNKGIAHANVKIFATVSLSLIPSLAWSVFTENIFFSTIFYEGLEPRKQLEFIKSNFIETLFIFFKSLFINIKYLSQSFIGHMGFRNPFSSALTYFYWGVLIFTLLIKFPKEKIRIPNILSWGNIFLSLVLIYLTSMSMYIVFTPVGSDLVRGIQGRYFIPIAILTFFLAPKIISVNNAHIKKTEIAILASWAILIFSAYIELINEYWTGF